MDELDSLFEGELASIDQVFHEFEIKDKKTEDRIRAEDEELAKVPQKNVVDLAPTLDLLEEVSKRRSMESMIMAEQWEKEMKELEETRLRQMSESESQVKAEDDLLLQDLDNQLKSLIQHKEEETRQVQVEKVKREKEEERRREEERERKERERQEKLANAEEQVLTVEEWIGWMEEKKKKGMTATQQQEYERRKQLRQEKDRERQEKLRMEEEEKRRHTKEIMEAEMKSYRQRQLEVEENRLSEEQLRLKQEELSQRQLVESRQRKERGEKMRQEDRDRETEALKPKARSALAARWEESVKARSNGNAVSRALQKSTVISSSTGTPASEETCHNLEKEEERLVKRISGSFPNGGVTLSPEKRRSSVQ